MDFYSDFLVIGSGIAGLSFALKASKLGSVTIITKKAKIDTATNLAQGGIAAVLSEEDSFDLHIEDTQKSGAGLCHDDVVRMVVEDGPRRIRELLQLGVHFSRNTHKPDSLDLGKEGGHSARRIAHAYDLTGKEIENALINRVAENPSIKVLENHLAVDLLLRSKAMGEKSSENDQCLGAYVLNRKDNSVETWQAKVTVLCTGGTGKVYLYTTNPDIATGDGIAMAYRAGAQVANLEFVQFHPTCLYHPQAKNFLISEAVRGEGGRLVNKNGQPFMQKYDRRGDLATRDMVARAIDSEMKTSGDDCVYLDVTHKDSEFIKNRFPNIFKTCLSFGIDMTRQPIPVVPAAHYMCGGILTDKNAQSSIKNLFALGETSCTGLHGGNRLASNSLLEAVVFAEKNFRYCRQNWNEFNRHADVDIMPWKIGNASYIDEGILISHNWDQIRRLMWNYVGIIRSEKRLRLARKRIEPILQEVAQHFKNYILTPDLVELRNIALIAELIVECSLQRKESRGLHYILDYPETDNLNWRHDTIFSKSSKN